MLFDVLDKPVVQSRVTIFSMHQSPLRRPYTAIEPLEQRIAPAVLTFVSPQTASFIDADGSRAYVTVTKGTLNASNFTLAPSGLGYQLETLDLSKADYKSEFEDATVNIYAHPGAGLGGGTVDVGFINATGIDLSGVRVHGDLGRINAGDTNLSTPAIVNIDVLSMGLLGTTTQAAGGNLDTQIIGAVRDWTIFGNFDGANILVSDNGSLTPASNDLNDHLSYIGHMDIRGSVIGGDTAGSGEIVALGGFKTLNIGGDLIGGSADNTGEIYTLRSILTLKVGGSLRGDGGDYSGTIDSVLIRHASIGDDVLGGAGTYSGAILGVGNNLITYGGEIMIGGDVTGGAGNNSGYISEHNPVQTTIGGDITGGAGNNSGEISATRAVDFRVGGSLVGGSGADSGSIMVSTVFNSVHVLRDMTGGSGDNSGSIESTGERIGHVTVTGSIQGGSPNSNISGADAIDSGSIVCTGSAGVGGGILSVVVGGSVTGGGGVDSGAISSAGSVGPVKIGDNLTAGSGAGSASILATDSIHSISIFGDIDGNTGTGVQFTGAATGLLPTLLVAGDIKVPLTITLPVTDMVVRGSIYAGDTGSGALVATTIDRLRIDGGILGSAANPVEILLSGLPGYDAINLLRVYTSVSYANILAGYAPTTPGTVTPYQVVNPSARIGTVSVDGDWAASNLVAGVSAGTDGQFGTADDFTTNTTAIFSEIAKIVIEGEAIGDSNPSDHFGFVAQEVASVVVADYAFPLTPGPGNDTSTTNPALNVGPTGNLTIHEVAAPV
jgi:hypothetical protein